MGGESPFPKWELLGVLPLTRRCPRRDIPDDCWRWLDLYQSYRAGHLWCAGGAGDQPAKYMAAMAVIDSTARQISNG